MASGLATWPVTPVTTILRPDSVSFVMSPSYTVTAVRAPSRAAGVRDAVQPTGERPPSRLMAVPVSTRRGRRAGNWPGRRTPRPGPPGPTGSSHRPPCARRAPELGARAGARRTHCPASMNPIKMALTRTPSGPSSFERAFMRARPAARETELGFARARALAPDGQGEERGDPALAQIGRSAPGHRTAPMDLQPRCRSPTGRHHWLPGVPPAPSRVVHDAVDPPPPARGAVHQTRQVGGPLRVRPYRQDIAARGERAASAEASRSSSRRRPPPRPPRPRVAAPGPGRAHPSPR